MNTGAGAGILRSWSNRLAAAAEHMLARRFHDNDAEIARDELFLVRMIDMQPERRMRIKPTYE